MTELAPCPFCNRELEHYAAIGATRHPKIPYEEYCPLVGFLFASDRTDIISAWNTRAQPRYLTGCLRDGVCRGVCENTDCPNHDMVVAARVCVEPKEAGIVYPEVES